jgi:hypothetical protein
MPTAPQSEYRAAAARRFPYSARCKTITGDGKFLLILKCTRPSWSVILYSTRQERDTYFRLWFARCEHHSNCRGQLHEKIELEVSAPEPEGLFPLGERARVHTPQPFRMPGDWEKD